MRLHYISPSTLPSRAANAVHVPLQCEGLVRAGAEVTLYAKRSMERESELLPALREQYGVDCAGLNAVTYYSPSARAVNLRIAALALAAIGKTTADGAVVSRNLYASYALGVLKRCPLVFETHQLEPGVRKLMQRAIMTRPWVTTLVISRELARLLEEHHGVAPSRLLVLPDAAPDGIEPVAAIERRARLAALVPAAAGAWDAVCGYFGQLYSGRGIDIIESMARSRPRCLFVVYGGNETDIETRRRSQPPANLHYGGHVPHPVAREIMRCCDVLLMPYQAKVSIGVRGHDTARWMSPMKMFEYLASGVPVISSDLPSLREVLEPDVNAVLVAAEDVTAWISALDRLLADPGRAAAIGARAHADYRARYTWTQRGRRILEAASAP